MYKSSLLLTEIFWSKKLSFKPISTNANVENWQWKWKLGIVAIFSLPITLLHPGHTGVGLQHPRINLGPRYDQDQDQRLGPGVVQEAGLGWAGLGWAERHKHQIKTFVFVGENEESFHCKQLNWGPGMN